jgi:hypothetical protein
MQLMDVLGTCRAAAGLCAGGSQRTMYTLPLLFKDGHLFVELEEELWLLDTGAPASFGATNKLSIAGKQFEIPTNSVGLTAAVLSQYVGVQSTGLLGGDVLNQFDHIVDAVSGSLTISTTELTHNGPTVLLDEFMGIPILTVQIDGTDYRMFFDTGAQISYFQGDSLSNFRATGRVKDFYPGVGQFETETHEVDFWPGNVAFTLRCGRLPGSLGAMLLAAGTEGIIGNQILANRVIGYFPRRRTLVL